MTASRRRAAILAADVAGYSRLMGADIRWVAASASRLYIVWAQAGVLGDPGQHPRPDLRIVVECKHVIGPARSRQNAM